MIIYAWQMLEGKKTDVLGLRMKVSKRIGNRKLQLGDIKKFRKDKTRMMEGMRTKILNSPERKMERLFNCMPAHLRDISGYTTEYFKKKLDEWLREEVPDQPKCGIYAGMSIGENNSIDVQYSASKRARN